jgi:hypothetical protein
MRPIARDARKNALLKRRLIDGADHLIYGVPDAT